MPSDTSEWVCRSIIAGRRYRASWHTGRHRRRFADRVQGRTRRLAEAAVARLSRGKDESDDPSACGDRPMMEAKEACGVFGVYAPGRAVAQLTFDGLYALQHRGQESAGMAVSDGETITVVKDMGLVTTVFDERTLSGLRGHLAIGHTRYSTAGSSDWRNAQPVFRAVGRAGFALGHNGNLTNTAELADGPACCRAWSPRTATWWPSCWPRPYPPELDGERPAVGRR